MKKPTIISILNHKGGVLKTTSTVNLGAALARAGKRVLVVDIDAQENLTRSLIAPIVYDENVPTLADAILNQSSVDDLIRTTSTPGLDIIPVTEDFCTVELGLAPQMGREKALKNCFSKSTRLSEYDYVMIDNPPSLSVMVMNSLVASDFYLVPSSAEFLPTVGLEMLGNSIGQAMQLSENLRTLGVFLTMYSRNERICRQVETMLKNTLGDKLLHTKIRINTKAKAAPSVKKTIFQYEDDATGRGTEDYTSLAAEVLERLAKYEAEDELPEVANG